MRDLARRWGWWCAVAALALVLLGWAGAAGGRSARRSARTAAASPSCPSAVRRLGMIAFSARGGRLELLDLARCRLTTLRPAGAAYVRFSPDGRWLASSQVVYLLPSRPVVMPVNGGAAREPLGAGVTDWSWGPRGAILYGLTDGGALLAATPTGPRRVLARNLIAAYSLAISPQGDLAAVDRSSCGARGVGELDTVNLDTGAVTVSLREPGHVFTLAGFSPDGRWLEYWDANMCSASLAADGWPLKAVPAAGGRPATAVSHMLLFDDFLSWCGDRLIAAAGPDRETETGSALVQTGPPGWRQRVLESARRLSWVSPACAPGGRLLAAAAGPGSAPVGFGQEHRSVWLLRAGGGVVRRLSDPPAPELSDEAPRFSRDGRWILFVRTHLVTFGETAFTEDTLELVPRSGANPPIPILDFTSDDFSYYDHFNWPYEIDWHQSRRG